MVKSTKLAGFNKTVINIRAITVMRKLVNHSTQPAKIMTSTSMVYYSRVTKIIDNTLDNIDTAKDCDDDEKVYFTHKFNMARMMIARGMFENAYNFLWDIILKVHMGELVINKRLDLIVADSHNKKACDKLGSLSDLPNDVLEKIKDMVEADFLQTTISALHA